MTLRGFMTLAALCSGLILLPQTLAAQRASSGVISGVVVSQAEGRPLPARVWLVGAARPGLPNARGTFRFDRLKPGRYHVRATYIGFLPTDTIVVISADAQVRLVMRLIAIPVDLPGITIRDSAKPPEPPKPSPRPVPPRRDCGTILAVGWKTILCTSPEMLPRSTIVREKEFFGPNSLILESALDAVTQSGFVRERFLQLNDFTWLIMARDPSRPTGLGIVRIEVEETGPHETAVRVSLTSAASVSRRQQSDRAQAFLSIVKRNLLGVSP